MQGLKSILNRCDEDLNKRDIVDYALETVRKHLGMDVGYLSEFVGDELVLRAVSSEIFKDIAYVGNRFSLDTTYCWNVVDGKLPQLIPDTSQEPVAMNMPITKLLPIGSHVGVPIRCSDGSVYGMFCCLDRKPNKSLNNRDLEVMRIFSELAAEEINNGLSERQRFKEKVEALENVIKNQAFDIVYQPIFDLFKKRPIGLEALCRFEAMPYRSPDKWFEDAKEVNLDLELEETVLKKALLALPNFPSSLYLSVNACPNLILTGKLHSILQDIDASRILVEVTEHAQVNDYELLKEEISAIKALGARVAIDDAGAGYSSLQHIIKLNPDVIKLDMSLTRDIDKDRSLRSLAAALIYFSRETGACIIAEGMETLAELETLKLLGVSKGQGYYLSRPLTLENTADFLSKVNQNKEKLSA